MMIVLVGIRRWYERLGILRYDLGCDVFVIWTSHYCIYCFSLGGTMKLTDEHYDYLMYLRDTGETNMWGAAPYLQREFGLSYEDSKAILVEWIKSFERVEE